MNNYYFGAVASVVSRSFSNLRVAFALVFALTLSATAWAGTTTFNGGEIEYTGTVAISGDGTTSRILTFKSSGTLTLSGAGTADILVVGGGGGGGGGAKSGSTKYYGNGGNGGQVVKASAVAIGANEALTVTVGSAGTGGSTSGGDGGAGGQSSISVNSLSASGGNGGSGGMTTKKTSADSTSAGTSNPTAAADRTSDITGTSTVYGAGGAKAPSSGDASSGTNYGDGGGGGRGGSSGGYAGAAGNGGVVIVKITSMAVKPSIDLGTIQMSVGDTFAVTNAAGAMIPFSEVTGSYSSNSNVATIVSSNGYAVVKSGIRDGSATLKMETASLIYKMKVKCLTVWIEKTIRPATEDDPADKSNATIRVTSHVMVGVTEIPTNRILFIGSTCTSHGLGGSYGKDTDEAKVEARSRISQQLNTLAAKGSVDWYLYGNGSGSASVIATVAGGYGHVPMGMTTNLTSSVAIASSRHRNLLAYLTKLDEALNTEHSTYDYVVLSFDGGRLAIDYPGGHADLEKSVAEKLAWYYTNNRVIWITDPQQTSDTYEQYASEYYRPSNTHDDGIMSVALWRALLAIVDPNLLLSWPDTTTAPYTYTKQATSPSSFTSYAASTNANKATYDNPDAVKKMLDSKVQAAVYDSELVDTILNLDNSLDIKEVKFYTWKGSAAPETQTNETIKVIADIQNDATHWAEEPASSWSREDYTIKANITNILKETWNKFEIKIVDKGTFLRKSIEAGKAKQDPETGLWEVDPNDGPAHVALYSTEGSMKVEVGARAQTTTILWTYEDPREGFTVDSDDVSKVYDGIPTNIVIKVTGGPADPTIQYRKVGDTTWLTYDPAAGFVNVADSGDVEFKVSKEGSSAAPYYGTNSVTITAVPTKPWNPTNPEDPTDLTPPTDPDPSGPYHAWVGAQNIVKCYDGLGTNVVAKFGPSTLDPTIRYSTNGTDFVTWDELQLTNVCAATKVYFSFVKDNYETVTNYAWVTITQRVATITFTAANKVFDNTTAAMCNGTNFANVVSGEGFTLNTSGMSFAFDTAAVGSGKTVTATGYNDSRVTATGETLKSNYSFNFIDTTTASITKAIQPGVDSDPYNGTYDGGKHTITVNPDGGTPYYWVDGEWKTTPPEYSDKVTTNVIFKVVKDGYEDFIGTNTVTISAKTVTLGSANGSWTYDTTAHTKHELTGVDGFVAGESFTTNWTGTITDVGTKNNTYTIGFTGTAKADNYALTTNYGTLTVTPAPTKPWNPTNPDDPTDLTPPTDPDPSGPYHAWVGAQNIVKCYDGLGTNVVAKFGPSTLDPTIRYSTNNVDFVTWDELQLTNVCAATKVYFSFVKDNYETVTNYAWVTITQRVATITFTAANKVFDTTTAATCTATNFANVVSGEGFTLNTSGMSFAFDTAAVGSGKTVTATGYNDSRVTAVGDTLKSNYSFNFIDTTTASITKESIEIGGKGPFNNENPPPAPPAKDVPGENDSGVKNVIKTYDGIGTNIVVEVTKPTSGSEVVYSVDGGLTYLPLGTVPSFTNAVDGTQVWYVVTAPGCDPVTNYAWVTIHPKAVTVTADNKSKVYGDADPELTATTAGTLGSDTVVYSLSRAPGEDVADSPYTITVSGDALQGNYSVTYTPGEFTITKKPVNDPTKPGDPAPGTGLDFGGEGKDKVPYKGTEWEPEVNVTNEIGTLTSSDFDVTYFDNIDSTNKAGIVITGKGNYSGVFTNYFEITKLPVKITADDKNIVYGSAVPATSFYTFKGEGFTNGETIAILTTQPTFGSAYTTTTPVGPIAITKKTDAEARNYTFTYVNGTLSVTKDSIKIGGKGPFNDENPPPPPPAKDDDSPNGSGVRNVIKTYDGIGTNIIVEVTYPAEHAVYYSTDGGNTWGNAPSFTNVVDGTQVWYMVEAPGCDTVTNYAYVTIKPREVTITSASGDFTYTGYAQSNATANAVGFVGDEGADYGNFKSIVTVSESGAENTFDYTLKNNTLAGNYTITVVKGTLTMKPADIVKEPPKEPSDPSDPTPSGTDPWTAARNVVKYFDNNGTNIIAKFANLMPADLKPEVLYSTNNVDFVPWEALQFTNVCTAVKVYYRVSDANYNTLTNHAFVTILAGPITPLGPNNPDQPFVPPTDGSSWAGAKNVVKIYDGIGTNIVAEYGKFQPDDSGVVVGYSLDENGPFGERVADQFVNVTNDAPVYFTVTAPNYGIITNKAFVTINPKSIGPVPVDPSHPEGPFKPAPGFTIPPIAPLTYDGQPQLPEVAVTNGTVELVPDVDYKFEYFNNTNATEEAYVVITGIGNYGGCFTNYFTILPREVTLTSGTKTMYLDPLKPGVAVACSNYTVWVSKGSMVENFATGIEDGFVATITNVIVSAEPLVFDVDGNLISNRFEAVVDPGLATNYCFKYEFGTLAILSTPTNTGYETHEDLPSPDPDGNGVLDVVMDNNEAGKFAADRPAQLTDVANDSVMNDDIVPAPERGPYDDYEVRLIVSTNYDETAYVNVSNKVVETAKQEWHKSDKEIERFIYEALDISVYLSHYKYDADKVLQSAVTNDIGNKIGRLIEIHVPFTFHQKMISFSVWRHHETDDAVPMETIEQLPYYGTVAADKESFMTNATELVFYLKKFSMPFVQQELQLTPLLSGRMRWKYYKAENAFYGGLDVACTNGDHTVISNLCYIYEDRDGFYLRNLSGAQKLSETSKVSYGGKDFGMVLLDATPLSSASALWTTNRYGVSDITLDSPRYLVPESERVIAMASKTIPDLATNKVSSVINQTLGYLTWQEKGYPEVHWCPLGEGLPPLPVDTLMSSAIAATPQVRAPLTLAAYNAAIGYGLPATTLDSDPSLEVSAFEVSGTAVSGKVATVGAGGVTGVPGENARIEVLGATSVDGEYSSVAQPTLGADGSFAFQSPDGVKYFKVRLSIVEVVK